MHPGKMLGEAVDIFSCCIFTWNALTTMVPAFFLAGAIAAFVSSGSVVKYLGPRAKKPLAYGTAALSGVLLSLCSCNVVPLFVSIYQRGAGLGPAITFLYAGPAINILSLIWVIRVIGWPIGIWRAMAVPLLALVMGLLMSWIFARQERERNREDLYYGEETRKEKIPLFGLIGLLLATVVVGGLDNLSLGLRLGLTGGLFAAVGMVLWRGFTPAEIRDWLGHTGKLVKLVLPILIPAVLLIGLLYHYIPLDWIYRLGLVRESSSGGESVSGINIPISPLSILGATVFGSLMYFPILTEVPFVKLLLGDFGVDVGPGLVILLTAPGLSLPGMIIVRKVMGTTRLLTYVGLLILLITLTGVLFSVFMGDYICPCNTIPELK